MTFWLIDEQMHQEIVANKILGREVGLLYDDLEALPKSFDSEAWRIERGLRA